MNTSKSYGNKSLHLQKGKDGYRACCGAALQKDQLIEFISTTYYNYYQYYNYIYNLFVFMFGMFSMHVYAYHSAS